MFLQPGVGIQQQHLEGMHRQSSNKVISILDRWKVQHNLYRVPPADLIANQQTAYCLELHLYICQHLLGFNGSTIRSNCCSILPFNWLWVKLFFFPHVFLPHVHCALGGDVRCSNKGLYHTDAPHVVEDINVWLNTKHCSQRWRLMQHVRKMSRHYHPITILLSVHPPIMLSLHWRHSKEILESNHM